MEVKGKTIEGKFRRECRLLRQAIHEDSRSVELAFSSEDPYERWFGTEVLGHEAKEVRMKRLKDGTHPFLLQHDTNKQIGVIEKAWIDEEGKKGRAIVRFAPETNALAEEVWQDVLAGIRSQISVGYHVHKFKEKIPLNEDGEPDPDKATYRAVDWEPFEISQVSIAADVTGAGIGKSHDGSEPTKQAETEEKTEDRTEEKPFNPVLPEVLVRKDQMDKEKTVSEKEKERIALEERQAREKAEAEAKQHNERLDFIRKQEKGRVDEIYAIANKRGCETLKQQAIEEGWSVDKFRQVVLDSIDSGTIIQHADTETASEGKSIGQLFIESPMYRELGSRIGTRRNITLDIPRQSFSSRVFSAATEGLTSIQKLPGVPGLLDQQQLYVSQIFPQSATSALTIRYIKEDAGNAYDVATGVAESGTKPEATLNVSEVDATVRKIAVYVKVTDEMLADHEAMRGYIDGRLAYMVQAHEDENLLNGSADAATNEITGIFEVSGINTYAAGGADTVHDAFGQALNKVRSVGFVEPDAIVCHPDDWTNLKLSKDSNGQYLGGGPFVGAYGVGGYSNVGTMWGLPVVVTTHCTKGTALVGSFRIGAQIFRRKGLTIEATNSEASDFINNRITIRAETRLALACYKPLAFCEITGIPA